jgi:hypothetical protein
VLKDEFVKRNLESEILGNQAQNRLADCLVFFIPKVSPQSGVPACDNAILLFADLDEWSGPLATVEIFRP